MKKFLVLASALLLTACVASLEEVNTNLNTKWTGKSYEEFAMEYGVARSSQKIQSGMTLYRWEEQRPCALNILVDTNNKIKSIKASGDRYFCATMFK